MLSFRRRLFFYLKPYRWSFLSALLQIFLISGCELIKPWPFKVVIDNVLTGKPLLWLPNLAPNLLLWIVCVSLTLVYSLSAALNLLNSYTTISFGQKMVNDLRGNLYSHLQRLSLKFHHNWALGDILYRVTSDTYAIQTLCISGLLPTVSSLLLIFGMFITLLRLDASLTLLALGVVPALFLLLSPLNKKISSAAHLSKQSESSVYSLVQRSISGIRVIQAFTKEEDEYQKFMSTSQGSLNANLRFYLLQSFYGGIANIVVGVWGALLLGVGAYHVSIGILTVGDLVIFVSYLGVLLVSIHQLSQTWATLQGAKAGVQRVFDLLNVEWDLQDGPLSLSSKEARGSIIFEDVSFHYLPDQPVLKHLNLRVLPGQKVAIVGATGAGKSTLVSLLSRFYDPQEGRITINGIDIREFQLKSLRSQISMVLQPPLVFPTTLQENIAYGCPQSTHEEIVAAAQLAHIHHFIKQLPQGYETVVGEQGVTLSEGQKQRLTIARAVLRNTPILILDEPTSAMDTETEALVMDGFEQFIAGKTTFIIAHRLSTIQRADQIVVMQSGQIVEQGTFDELMTRPGVFAALYKMQFREYQQQH